jgi:hypothetical protein
MAGRAVALRRHILRKLDLPRGMAHNRRVHAVLIQLRG